MITPKFKLDQDDESVVIEIYAPCANMKAATAYAEDNTFCFSAQPYFLRLTLPGKIQGDPTCTYNDNKYIFTAEKATKGEFFPNLNMLTTLLDTRRKSAAKPAIEVVENGDVSSTSDDDDSEFDWFAEQEVPEDVILTGAKYGFANERSGLLGHFQDDLWQVVDIGGHCEQMTLAERRQERLAKEKSDFDKEHYLADFFELDEITPLLEYKAPWEKILKIDPALREEELGFTPAEMERMLQLKNREYLHDSTMQQVLYLGVVDIMYAFAYNHRVSEGENHVESAWNITKLSSTLSWFESFSNIQDVVISSIRRSLAYPLYRNWALALKVLSDTESILRLGKQYVLKCLLEIYTLFNESEPRYILNQFYLDDYCVWIQKCSDARLLSLADSISQLSIQKKDVDLDLPEVEAEACDLVASQQSSVSTVADLEEQVSRLRLRSGSESGSSGSESCDSDSYESDSESTSESDTSDSSTVTPSGASDSESLDSDDLTESED